MKIGVTGGAGFIGGYVVDVALERGHEVVVFDSRGRVAEYSNLNAMHQHGLGQRIEKRLGDVRDATAMTELAAHVDGIIHLAACLGTQETIRNPRPAAETNIVGGLNFLEACTQYGIPGVYIGVGNHWMDNTYSISKTTVERFVRMFNAERGGKFNIVRLVNAYGPGQSIAPPFGPAKVRKITPSFICRALTGNPIEVYGDGSQVSDMVYVRDGAEALVRSLESAAEGIVFDRPVEVGSVRPVTVGQVAEYVRQQVALKLTGSPVNPVPIVNLPMRPGETPGTPVVADTSTLEFVGMDPADLVQLGPGLEATIDWYAAHWLPGYQAQQASRREPTIDLFSRRCAHENTRTFQTIDGESRKCLDCGLVRP
jgi:nucleoside-diphosphate-sugar epimerase